MNKFWLAIACPKLLRRWMVPAVLGIATLVGGLPQLTAQEPARSQASVQQPQQTLNPEIASVEQLKLEAFKALRGGQFDRTSELLSKAATLSNDPTLTQMSQWLHQFQAQRQELVAEKHKAFEKAVADVRKLLDNDYADFAVDKAKDAYLLAEDKQAFIRQPWVAQLIAAAKSRAADYEAREMWREAQLLYSNLNSLEPGDPQWKQKFKSVTNRLRLLAVYTPETFKQIIEEDSRRREAADQLLRPTTQPTSKPVEVEENDSFRTDWRDMLRGIRFDMLLTALDEACNYYYRPVSYKTLTVGGLNGLRALASTRGLERAFANLGDEQRRSAFLEAIDSAIRRIEDAPPAREKRITNEILESIKAANATSVQLPEEVLVSEFADGAFGELDPFTTMIWPSDLEEFNKSTQGEFSGVGIQIQLDDEGNLKVVSPLEDSPAYKQGIHPGDIIIRINGKNAKGISINQAVKNITGPKDTFVTLTIRSPDGTVKDYTIRREVIKVASVKGYQHRPGGGWDYFIDPAQKIAYVRLTNFTKTTEDELSAALREIERQGGRAMILDLRNNPGGLLPAATEVCDRFLSEGTIVFTRGEREMPGQPPIEARKGDEVALPVVVLVNQFSASASEIVSGALQDQKRALVVGERTFGKGSVQMLFPLANRSAALKLTTSHYYLPSGRNIHKEDNAQTWGVEPDLVVEMTTDQMRAAQQARQELEVLYDSRSAQQTASTGPATQTSKDLLAADAQLSAAVLLLRLQLAGATL